MTRIGTLLIHTIFVLTIVSLVIVLKESSNWKTTFNYFLLVAAPFVLLIISDLAFSNQKIGVMHIIWRVVAAIISILVIVSAFITLGKNCNYACGYPIFFVSIANYIFVAITFVALIITSIRNTKTESPKE